MRASFIAQSIIARSIIAGSIFVAFAVACVDSARAPTALGEPIRVENGQFHEGAQPQGTDGPAVITYDSSNNLVPQGALNRKLTGDVKKGASAIAIRFADIGSGYWIVPVGVPDPQTDGDLTYEIDYDLDRLAPIGDHTLRLSAVDLDGHWGPVQELPITIASRIPQGQVVITLEWDTDVDLDLELVAPWGKTLDAKHPSTAPTAPDSGIDPTTPGVGELDHDSNGNCVIDGLREESAVFSAPPFPGLYHVYANLFDACGRDSARFTLTVRVDGEVKLQRAGEVLAAYDSTGGQSLGLFVTDVQF